MAVLLCWQWQCIPMTWVKQEWDQRQLSLWCCWSWEWWWWHRWLHGYGYDMDFDKCSYERKDLAHSIALMIRTAVVTRVCGVYAKEGISLSRSIITFLQSTLHYPSSNPPNYSGNILEKNLWSCSRLWFDFPPFLTEDYVTNSSFTKFSDFTFIGLVIPRANSIFGWKVGNSGFDSPFSSSQNPLSNITKYFDQHFSTFCIIKGVYLTKWCSALEASPTHPPPPPHHHHHHNPPPQHFVILAKCGGKLLNINQTLKFATFDYFHQQHHNFHQYHHQCHPPFSSYHPDHHQQSCAGSRAVPFVLSCQAIISKTNQPPFVHFCKSRSKLDFCKSFLQICFCYFF